MTLHFEGWAGYLLDRERQRRAAAKAAIRAAPTDAVNRISDRTGIARPLVMSVKREMVKARGGRVVLQREAQAQAR